MACAGTSRPGRRNASLDGSETAKMAEGRQGRQLSDYQVGDLPRSSAEQPFGASPGTGCKSVIRPNGRLPKWRKVAKVANFFRITPLATLVGSRGGISFHSPSFVRLNSRRYSIAS